jgi:hypothetical protein
MDLNRHNKNRRRQRDVNANGVSSGGFGQSRSICKAPRLDNSEIIELHSDEKPSLACISSAQRRQSEFLNLWLEQLEETSRAMPHEKLLQRVLELESELLDTQEKLKKANHALYRKKTPKTGGKSPKIVSAPNSPLYSSPRYTPHASPMYTCSPSPIYQSPRYLVSPTAE